MPDMEFYTDDRDKSEEYVGHVKVAYSGGVSRSRGGGGGSVTLPAAPCRQLGRRIIFFRFTG